MVTNINGLVTFTIQKYPSHVSIWIPTDPSWGFSWIIYDDLPSVIFPEINSWQFHTWKWCPNNDVSPNGGFLKWGYPQIIIHQKIEDFPWHKLHKPAIFWGTPSNPIKSYQILQNPIKSHQIHSNQIPHVATIFLREIQGTSVWREDDIHWEAEKLRAGPWLRQSFCKCEDHLEPPSMVVLTMVIPTQNG